MKNILFTTTALALSMGVTSAYAMSNAEIKLSGNSKWTYESADDGTDNEGGANDVQFKIGNSVTVSSSQASDSGLTYGTSLTIHDGGGAIDDDGMKLFIKGSFGELRTGSAGAGDSLAPSEGGLVEGESSQVGGSDTAVAGDSSISYFSPSVNGLEGAITFTDAGLESKADSTELAIKFTTGLMGNALSLQYANMSMSDDGSEGSESSSASSIGLAYELGDVNLRLAQHSHDTGDEATEVSSLGYGLSYQVNDALKLGLYARDGEIGDDATSESAASLTYTVAPGLTTNLAYTTWTDESKDAGDSGTTTSAYIKVAF